MFLSSRQHRQAAGFEITDLASAGHTLLGMAARGATAGTQNREVGRAKTAVFIHKPSALAHQHIISVNICSVEAARDAGFLDRLNE